MRVAMVGTRGVPARYGGFETAVEEIGWRLAARGHEIVVYCRSAEGGPSTYRGMQLVDRPFLPQKAVETLSHTAVSTLHVRQHPPDVVLLFNAANAPFLPLLRGLAPVATHVDGLEWKRGKWGRTGRQYYQLAERLAVRWSDALIADARGIQRYYQDRYGADSDFLAYGAPILRDLPSDRLAEMDLRPGEFHLVVARFEPENHVDMIVAGYRTSSARWPLVVVGSAPYAGHYTARVEELARGDERIRLVGGVWDQQLLDQLYAHSTSYLHGHSVGGTNPSLLRAMGAGAFVVAYDVDFNREVLGGTGRFFGDERGVAEGVEFAEEADVRSLGLDAQRRAEQTYDWEDVTDGYERLCERLLLARSRRA